VVSFEPFHEVLKAMEEEGIVLNLHGERPSSAAEGVTVMNAEARFLPVLKELVEKYPQLKIVLEHCTTADAVEAVRSLGENVVGTIVSLFLFEPTTVVTEQAADGGSWKDGSPPLSPRRRLVRQCGKSTPFLPSLAYSLLTAQAPLLQTLGQVPRGSARPPQRSRY
jgi:hypothetical protein